MAETILCAMIAVLGGWISEQWMSPVPNSVLRRPWRANLIHFAALLTVFGVYLILTRRPWLASALTLGLPILLIVINNVKHTHLREPFVASDWNYFIEAIRYPRLYLPFFGQTKALLMLGFFLIILLLWIWLESVSSEHISTLLAIGMTFIVTGGLCLKWGCASWPDAQRSYDYDAESDLIKWGLFATLALYRHDLKHKPPATKCSPFLSLSAPDSDRLPHFVSIQAESFFDLQRHFAGHLSENWLLNWGTLKQESTDQGPLLVPAWGANTVRTEFAFLTGLSDTQLGVHRFQPYASVPKHPPQSLASYLKSIGFETIFLHPYLKSFYNRHRVVPQLGFETFLDITTFDSLASSNHYVSDLVLGDKLINLLKNAEGPAYIHAVTMAGHGPYARKGASPAEILDKYAARMADTDAMIGRLCEALPALDRPVVLCVFGDHPPILPEVYAWLGMPDGTTDYALWCTPCAKHTFLTSSETPKPSKPQARSAHDLALDMLKVSGFVHKLKS